MQFNIAMISNPKAVSKSTPKLPPVIPQKLATQAARQSISITSSRTSPVLVLRQPITLMFALTFGCTIIQYQYWGILARAARYRNETIRKTMGR